MPSSSPPESPGMKWTAIPSLEIGARQPDCTGAATSPDLRNQHLVGNMPLLFSPRGPRRDCRHRSGNRPAESAGGQPRRQADGWDHRAVLMRSPCSIVCCTPRMTVAPTGDQEAVHDPDGRRRPLQPCTQVPAPDLRLLVNGAPAVTHGVLVVPPFPGTASSAPS